jgi:hypothetical protein
MNTVADTSTTTHTLVDQRNAARARLDRGAVLFGLRQRRRAQLERGRRQQAPATASRTALLGNINIFIWIKPIRATLGVYVWISKAKQTHTKMKY